MWTKHTVFRGLLRVFLCLALAATALAAPKPRPAEAATLVVDRNDDTVVTACTGAPNDCTLRGAIQVANTNAVTDTITFSSTMNISLVSTLVLSATGTTIQATALQTVTINANNLAGTNVFRIRANDITLERLRVFGSGSGNSNIWISDAAQRIRIAYSVIGDDAYGFNGTCGNSPNSYSGIYINSTANPVGSDAVAWIYGSSLKCNGGTPGHGIEIAGADEVVIGADSAGNAGPNQFNLLQLNNGDGAYLSAGANFNTIRNSALQYNNEHGLVIDNSDSNAVYGNYFQVNDLGGIVLQGSAASNRIGCPLGTLNPDNEDLRNVIHQNSGGGVLITGANTNANLVLCNWIGLDDDGTGAAPNTGTGVTIAAGARSNQVGASDGTRNVIGGNAGNGVRLTGTGTFSNTVRGNLIGTNAGGTGPVPNEQYGVRIDSGASLNVIGGSSFDELNLIAGNDLAGVLINNSTTATNTVTYNDIGYNSNLTLPIPNGTDGIYLVNGTHHNVIGGVGVSNYIAYNQGNGVLVLAGARNTSISVNRIFSNTRNGVLLDGADTSFNVLTGTVIFDNGEDGIAERAAAGINVWQHISTFANGGLAVDKDAASPSTNIVDGPFPTITSVNPGTGQIIGTASNSALIEVYAAFPDVSRHGEGQTFLGSTVSDGSGNWSITLSPGLEGCFTAAEMVGLIIYASSEFGPNTCHQVFLPVVQR